MIENSTIYCANICDPIDSWANFQHFRSPQRAKRHVDFSNGSKTATKTTAHSKPTYIFTAGSVSTESVSTAAGSVCEWSVAVESLGCNDGSRMSIGLFQGRDIRLDLDPIEIDWQTQYRQRRDSIAQQAPIWCVTSDGLCRAQDNLIGQFERGDHLLYFHQGDVVHVCVFTEADMGARLQFFLNQKNSSHLLADLNVFDVELDDLHLFVALQSLGDAATIFVTDSE